MSVFCQIQLNKPPEDTFCGGEVISGIIKYSLDEPMEIERIIVSLKGMGDLTLIKKYNKKVNSYTAEEVYIDANEIVQENNSTKPAGNYDIPFRFKLPEKIPPSLKYEKIHGPYCVICNIKYYIRIKFDKPGCLDQSKHFRKKITVISPITPKLSTEPVMYGEKRKLPPLFPNKISTVAIKANILNSVVLKGGKIDIESEIENDSYVKVKGVEVKLMEVYTLKPVGHGDIKFYDNVMNCESRTSSIKSGATKIIPLDLIVPTDTLSLQNSKIVSRDYVVTITAQLPIPLKNVVLEIPVQIGDHMPVERPEVTENPPAYFEAMGEKESKVEGGND
ncbi:unnamed protein product [Spodoptera littoralis]|uniref:Arrestin C-terminal-like domain-containing protein n=1 Tax=Spodoptera littoralis TaxID=7109 RepID=A0A9P0N8M7_SPOLI|nr:unnamed protein product [Spodoptera littoralis]CAH1646449.1 unnamed protein product [Spodoptera littoralis]